MHEPSSRPQFQSQGKEESGEKGDHGTVIVPPPSSRKNLLHEGGGHVFVSSLRHLVGPTPLSLTVPSRPYVSGSHDNDETWGPRWTRERVLLLSLVPLLLVTHGQGVGDTDVPNHVLTKSESPPGSILSGRGRNARRTGRDVRRGGTGSRKRGRIA